jgi:hypothetical protein
MNRWISDWVFSHEIKNYFGDFTLEVFKRKKQNGEWYTRSRIKEHHQSNYCDTNVL